MQQVPLWQPPPEPPLELMEQQSASVEHDVPFLSVHRGGTPSLQQLNAPQQ